VQLAAHDLAGTGRREIVDELRAARLLVGSAISSALRDELVGVRVRPA
jgi:hypothetical protein